MRYHEVLPYIESGNWECDYSLPGFIKEIERMEREEGLQINPDFQRGHVWTEAQQIAFVEHILRGGKNGKVVYLNYPDWDCLATRNESDYRDVVCIDGLQRITAVGRFVRGEIRVFGTYYADFGGRPRGAQGLKININTLQSRREVLEWYLQLNTGGTPHTEAEITRVQQLLDEAKDAENCK